jgi:hypothetical protein
MTRYWKEFKHRGLEKLEEMFNLHHSKLRNVVERSFGVAKNKWQMLKGVAHYPKDKQCHIIVACFALHSFVIDENARSATVNRMPIPGVSHFLYQWVASNVEDDMSTVCDWITTGLGLLGYRYVFLHHA